MDCKLKIQDPSAMGAAEDVTTDVLSRSPNRPNFGNTGELENLRIAKNYVPEGDVTSSVPCSIPGILFKPQDFNPEYERNINAALSLKGLFKGAFDAKKSPRNSKSSHVSEEREVVIHEISSPLTPCSKNSWVRSPIRHHPE